MLLLIDARHLKAVEGDEVPKLFQQNALIGRTRTWFASDFLRSRAPGLAVPHGGEPLLRTHIALLTWQVKSIAHAVLIHVLLVAEELVVLLHGEFRHRDVVLGIHCYDYRCPLLLLLNYSSKLKRTLDIMVKRHQGGTQTSFANISATTTASRAEAKPF
jgi:hypothetical protein